MKKIILCAIVASALFAESLSLENAYERALDYEAKVRSFKEQVYAKNEDITQAKSRLYPKIDFQTMATNRDYIVNGSGSQREENYYTYTLSGQIPIYNPENYNLIDQAKLKYDYSNLHLEQLTQELGYNVVDAYMSIVRAKNSLLVAESYLQTNQIKYEQISHLYEKRLANRMDFLESKLTFEQSKVKVSSEKHNLHLALVKFKNLTGLAEPKLPYIDFEKVDISTLHKVLEDEELISGNLEILKSKVGIKLADKQIEQAYYGHYPKVELSASISKYDTDSIYTDYKEESKIMLSFKLPLYQGGYTQSLIAKNKYLLSASQEELEDIKRQTKSQFEELVVLMNNAKENISLYKDSIESAKLYLHAVNQGYEKGLKNLVDLEDAKSKLYESKFKLIDSVYSYIKSYMGILNLSGQLSKERLVDLDNILLQTKK